MKMLRDASVIASPLCRANELSPPKQAGRIFGEQVSLNIHLISDFLLG